MGIGLKPLSPQGGTQPLDVDYSVHDAPLVSLTGLTKRFGSHTAVHPSALDIYRGDFLAILGPSGCGKTSLLRMIGGFLEASGGSVKIDGVDVTHMRPERRPTNMVFQGYGLFPHMTVRQNIAYGLRITKVAPAEIEARVEEAIDLVHLNKLADRPVPQLSGGQAQRVALARALIMRPKVLLLDEPLAALDLKLRKAMQEELRRIHRSIGGTFVFVTHDQEEAMGLANRMVVMHDGRIVQEGTPAEVYSAPKTRFVATFVGEASLLPGARKSGLVALEAGPRFPHAGPDGPVSAMVRPEAFTLLAPGSQPPGGEDWLTLEGRLADVVFLGHYVKYPVEVGALKLFAIAPVDPRATTPAVGSETMLAWRRADQKVMVE
jgi:ABC-type Fe3+/spermidine/putrescine transport system ATPase subunit